jgi:hypothetical protein
MELPAKLGALTAVSGALRQARIRQSLTRPELEVGAKLEVAAVGTLLCLASIHTAPLRPYSTPTARRGKLPRKMRDRLRATARQPVRLAGG